MSVAVLDSGLWFPPVDNALPDGLLAIGGDLSTERLLLAYRHGIFPWYDYGIPLWWCPNPRFVIFPHKLKVSKSMNQLLRKGYFDFRINTAFSAVIENCRQIPRKEQDGTWINDDVVQAYTRLHELGYAFSAEAWQGENLVGGLYGVKMGNVFFGESMFSHQSNASKYAFISYVRQLVAEGIELVDCQVYTTHLESLGAEMIPRSAFSHLLRQYIP